MSDYASIKMDLSDGLQIQSNSFSILKEISNHINHRDTYNEGRDLVIRALASIDKFDTQSQKILMSLVRNVGLFPYMTDFLNSTEFEDRLAYELHRTENLDSNIIFHALQAKIYYQLMSGANVVLSASTSVGKSLIIDSLIASQKFRSVVIIVPTIALIDETRRRLSKLSGDDYKIITHPSQKASDETKNIFILTQERVLSRDDFGNIDLFIMDEFYKVNLLSDENQDRAIDLNLAFQKLAQTGAQFYLLGPNIQHIAGLETYEYHFIPSEFSTVAVDIFSYDLPTTGTARKEKLLDLIPDLDQPTIIYCQSPESARKVAKHLVESHLLDESPYTSDAVNWMSDNYHPSWITCEALRFGIGMHHGGVPRALQQYFIRLFNERKIKHLICTSTIIEGVNTVAKNVIIYDRRKSKGVLDYFDYQNIQGRAGRMMEYYVGKVFCFETSPEEQSYSVEFPIGHQNESTPINLLLGLDEDSLQTVSKTRLRKIFDENMLSEETLRKNRHISVDTQERIAESIVADLLQYEDAITWKQIPTGPQLRAVCEIIFDFLSESTLRGYGVHSGAALARQINVLRSEKSLKAFIEDSVRNTYTEESPSEAVERALKFIRNIICFRFPRDLMVVDSIQKDIFGKLGVEAGDYGLFAEMTENLFMPPSLFALDEFGIPLQTAQQMSSLLRSTDTLDTVIAEIKNIHVSDLDLSKFEKNLLNDVLQWL